MFGWFAKRVKDAAQAMAHVVDRAGEHGTGYLKEDKTRTRIDVGPRRLFKCDQERRDLQTTEQQKTKA